MLPFSFVEMFFFLSLGITFVLILLIVYHFKRRITSIENKSDTMFDIVKNLAKEVSDLKNERIVHSSQLSSNGFEAGNMYMPHIFMHHTNAGLHVTESE